MPLSDIEAICIDTRDINLANHAAQKMQESGIRKIKILTDSQNSKKLKSDEFEVFIIPNLQTIDDYSKFVLEDLHKFVEFEHFIIFQWDGFILNKNLWWDGYLEYDYIGAPWPKPYRPLPAVQVGNGGFSMRSKRLTMALPQLGIKYAGTPEDAHIATQLQIDENLSNFLAAPADIARHFSAEHQSYLPAETHVDTIPSSGTFGFHGWFNFHMAYGDLCLVNYVNNFMQQEQRQRILGSWANGTLLANLYNNGRIECAAELAGITCREFKVEADFNPKMPNFCQSVINWIYNR